MSHCPNEYEIKNECAPLFDKYGINFFNFGRLYDNGTCRLLSSNQSLLDHFFEKGYPLFSPVPENILKKKFYYLIQDTGAYSEINREVRNVFKTENGFDIFEINKGYVDVCCFGSRLNHDGAFNVYLNNLPSLENFIKNFKEKFLTLTNNNGAILLPESMRLNFSSAIIKPNQIETMLSARELDCLSHMLQGKSARETSILLGLSKRTVEHYIENIKDKFGISKKSELIEKAINYLEN